MVSFNSKIVSHNFLHFSIAQLMGLPQSGLVAARLTKAWRPVRVKIAKADFAAWSGRHPVAVKAP